MGGKLDEYVLNEKHPRGRHKARVFKSVLGISVGNSYLLQQTILDAAMSSDEAVETQGLHTKNRGKCRPCLS